MIQKKWGEFYLKIRDKLLTIPQQLDTQEKIKLFIETFNSAANETFEVKKTSYHPKKTSITYLVGSRLLWTSKIEKTIPKEL